MSSPRPQIGSAAVSAPQFPQSWNRYAYVGGMPLESVDPLGLWRVVPPGCYYDEVDGIVCPPVGGGGGGGGGNGCSNTLAVNGGHYSLPALGCGGEDDGGGGGVKQQPKAKPDEVPANPCTGAGGAPDPNWYAAQISSAGQVAFPGTGIDAGGRLINGANQFFTLLNFRRGGYLDAQPLGATTAYANYVFGAALAAGGYSLRFSLLAAAAYARASGATATYHRFDYAMDPNYPSLSAANVANISNGFNAEISGRLCKVR